MSTMPISLFLSLSRRAFIGSVVVLSLSSHQVVAQGLELEDEVIYSTFRAVPTYRAYLPENIDLSSGFPIPQTQGDQASCTGWAVGYSLRSYYAIKNGKMNPQNKKAAFSPAYIYNQIIENKGNCTEGVRISDALKFMVDYGAASMADFPYVLENCSALPTRALTQKARPNSIDGWKRVDLQTLDDVKGELANGDPVAFGIMITEKLERLKADEVYDDRAGPDDIGHAMVVTGYDDSKRAFKVMNSWGNNWADGGFGWISYDSFTADTNSAFVMRLAKLEPQPKPKPKPKLEPVQAIDMTSLAKRLTNLGNGFKCSQVNFAIKPDGTLAGHGYVANGAGVALLQAAGRSAGPDAVDVSDIKVRPWPQCEALETFEDEMAAATGLRIALRSKSGATEFIEDDKLVVLVRSPEYPSYLYVTYLMVSGDAVHLYQSDWRQEPIMPNTLITLGNDPTKPSFQLAEPFGKEMVIVLASKEPLIEREINFVEMEREYLSMFRQQILRLKNFGDDNRVVARAAFLTTKPKAAN